jgi:hypothetical protein
MHRPLCSRHTPCAVRPQSILSPNSYSMSQMIHSKSRKRRRHTECAYYGYTLIEILTATTLSLLLLGVVVQMFGKVGRTITESRSMLESADRLRSVATLMQKDLEGITVKPGPQGIQTPMRPEDGPGYLEIIEGSIMATRSGVHPNILHNTTNPPPPTPYGVPVNREQSAGSANQVRFKENGQTVTLDVDTSVGDYDDVLLMTTRSKDKPFIGRSGGGTIQSDVAEVVWFIRGRKLYRRVLLVAPEAVPGAAPAGFYANYDISVHYDFQRSNLVGNTLSDLTRRECRYGHPIYWDPNTSTPILFPCDVRDWGQLRLPTLLETSFITIPGGSVSGWPAAYFPGGVQPAAVQNSLVSWDATTHRPGLVIPPPSSPNTSPPTTDFWRNLPIRDPEYLIRNNVTSANAAHPNNPQNVDVRYSNPTYMLYDASYVSGDPARADMLVNSLRYSDDVVLDNVIGFDVKVWDPGAPLFYVQNNLILDPNNLPAGANPQVVSMNDIPYSLNELNMDIKGHLNWAVGAGAYVDLGYATRFWRVNGNDVTANNETVPTTMLFGDIGAPASGLSAADYNLTNGHFFTNLLKGRVYDTWSTHYENTLYNPFCDLRTATPNQPDSSRPDLFPGKGTNGFDDPVLQQDGSLKTNGTVDDAAEQHVPPPYSAPLRGIQIKIRVFDPDSRQVLERTIVQDFMPR